MISKAEEPLASYGVPSTLNPVALINFMGSFDDDKHYLHLLKQHTHTSDGRIAYWLNMNVKTYRNHRDSGAVLKADTREHLIMLMTMVRQGLRVFGSSEAFGQWLEAENFMLDKRKPADFLNTNSGLRLIKDRLTGMEYGDNA